MLVTLRVLRVKGSCAKLQPLSCVSFCCLIFLVSVIQAIITAPAVAM